MTKRSRTAHEPSRANYRPAGLWRWLCVAAAALLATAFAQPSVGEAATDLFGASEWVVERLVLDGDAVELASDVPTNLVLLDDQQALAGTAGCNRMTARFELRPEANQIEFEPITATLMACPEPAMSQERQIFEALEAVAGYRRDRGRVILTGPDTELALRSRAPSGVHTTPPRQLELDAFNAAVAAAASAGAHWPEEPLRVVMALVDLVGAQETKITVGSPDRVAEPVEVGAVDSLLVTVEESGLLDDSVLGITHSVTLGRGEGYWLVTGHEIAWQCARGADPEVIEPLRCP